MSITSITAGGQNYHIDVTEQDGKKIVTESAVKAAAAGIADDRQLKNIYTELFKSGIRIKLDSGTEVSNMADLERALENLEGLKNNGMDSCVFDIAAMLRIFAQCNQSMRDSARQTRNAEMTSQVNALKSSADELRTAAEKQLWAGLAQGAAGIVAGVVQIGASALQMRSATKALDSSNQAADFKMRSDALKSDADTMEFHAGSNQDSLRWRDQSIGLQKQATDYSSQADMNLSAAKAYGDRGTGTAGIINSSGSALGTYLNHEAKQHEIDSTDMQTEAKIHETAMQHANDLMQNTLEIIRDIRSQIGAMQQTQSETNRGIARNI